MDVERGSRRPSSDARLLVVRGLLDSGRAMPGNSCGVLGQVMPELVE
jgi:hypothetical protein